MTRMAESPPARLGSPERVVFFTDAVVAIAMTLLILPLLEHVSAAGAEGLTAAEVLARNGDGLWVFVFSFVMIAMFWRMHHDLFEHVALVDERLVWVNNAWMLTIIWMPVSLSLVNAVPADTAQKAVYVGSMLACTLVMVGMQLVVRRSPAMWADGQPPRNGGLAATLALALLLTVVLVVALLVPGGQGYLAMFLMALTAPLQKVISRRLPAVDSAEPEGIR